MKKLLGLSALILSLQGLFARPLPVDVLRFEHISRLAGGTNHVLTVNHRGEVFHQETSARPVPTPRTLVARLPAYEMDRIYRLIDQAQYARLEREPVKMYCFAPSAFTLRYTANGGSTLLRSGAPCDGFLSRKSPAAAELTRTLNHLEGLAHGRTAIEGVN